ncbi:hypothetical protein Q5762_28270 [Streptomyces sp. P9(2023)]|uniref:hypothetical protein n=1 Tax=Streptomyces sp. P9(2023) TaxID=3064394 RepID=UPI0028F443CE|nr:hypothetical protein [Streptomyces sp. P9(2023)]MDT9692157.1 hypothetical protein [Streptomyces sp. P9(2023)]
MSEITGTGIPVAHEAYAFACMRCGYGWEQAYDIEHHIDAAGNEFIVYKAGGERVPSPLSSPTCMNCGGHVVRIMRAGQVSSVLDSWEQAHHRNVAGTPHRPVTPAGPIGLAGPIGQDLEREVPAAAPTAPTPPAASAAPAAPTGDVPGPVHVEERRRRRLSDLFRPSRRK